MAYSEIVETQVHYKLLKDVDKRFVYYGELSNTLLEKPTEDPASRQQALSELKKYKTSPVQ